eukprot:Sspe_Gene.33743::Locus_16450_Transcript_1_1_Confidence_1.000_Length_6022::g.33743::m.33743
MCKRRPCRRQHLEGFEERRVELAEFDVRRGVSLPPAHKLCFPHLRRPYHQDATPALLRPCGSHPHPTPVAVGVGLPPTDDRLGTTEEQLRRRFVGCRQCPLGQRPFFSWCGLCGSRRAPFIFFVRMEKMELRLACSHIDSVQGATAAGSRGFFLMYVLLSIKVVVTVTDVVWRVGVGDLPPLVLLVVLPTHHEDDAQTDHEEGDGYCQHGTPCPWVGCGCDFTGLRDADFGARCRSQRCDPIFWGGTPALPVAVNGDVRVLADLPSIGAHRLHLRLPTLPLAVAHCRLSHCPPSQWWGACAGPVASEQSARGGIDALLPHPTWGGGALVEGTGCVARCGGGWTLGWGDTHTHPVRDTPRGLVGVEAALVRWRAGGGGGWGLAFVEFAHRNPPQPRETIHRWGAVALPVSSPRAVFAQLPHVGAPLPVGKALVEGAQCRFPVLSPLHGRWAFAPPSPRQCEVVVETTLACGGAHRYVGVALILGAHCRLPPSRPRRQTFALPCWRCGHTPLSRTDACLIILGHGTRVYSAEGCLPDARWSCGRRRAPALPVAVRCDVGVHTQLPRILTHRAMHRALIQRAHGPVTRSFGALVRGYAHTVPRVVAVDSCITINALLGWRATGCGRQALVVRAICRTPHAVVTQQREGAAAKPVTQ